MKRRQAVQAGVATLVLGTAGTSLLGTAIHKPTESEPLAMTDSNLINSIDSIFGEHMDAELAGDLDKTLATMSETSQAWGQIYMNLTAIKSTEINYSLGIKIKIIREKYINS